MHHIVFLERDSVRARIRRPAFPHSWVEYALTGPDELLDRVREATIIVCNKAVLRGDVLAQVPGLRMVAGAATGTDNIDLAWCRASGVVVSNIRGYAVHAVPEHALMLMLALRRNLLTYRAALRAGRWQQSTNFCFFDYPIGDLHGATLGIVGRGSLGEGVATLARAFGMRVVYAERKGAADVRPGFTRFDEVLAAADVISLHCPLAQDTRNLIGAAELRAMRRDAILINTGRGGLVDEVALLTALREGWIAGAGVDVLSREPPAEGNSLLDADLTNLIVTPHIAWASDAAMQTLADQLIDNIEAFERGEPMNRVA